MVYVFIEDNFFHLTTNIVHTANPPPLIFCLQMFSDFLLSCHLLNQLGKHLLGLLVNVHDMGVKFPAEQ